MSVIDFKEVRAPIRHILSFDGTWQSDKSEIPSNVKLLHDTLIEGKQEGDLFYQKPKYFNGVATEGSALKRAWNGATGADLEEKICEAYEYLCKNYKPGDDIVLSGFSRGAFTARSLNGMIYKCGIIQDADKLSPEELKEKVQEAFSFYRNSTHPKDEMAVNHRAHNFYDDNPKISLGVFETVGELGIPKQFIIANAITRWRYKFHDTTLNENTKVAIHALGIDEQRVNFEVTPMNKAKGSSTILNQEYFIGNHTAVGGGSIENRGLSDISGKWMADQLAQYAGVKLNPKILEETFHPDPTVNPTTDFKPESKWWEFAGLEQRTIPKDAVINGSVTERFNKVASYRPAEVLQQIQTMIAEAGKSVIPAPQSINMG